MNAVEAKRLQTRLGVLPDGEIGAVTYAALFARLAGRPCPNAAAFGRGAAKHFPTFEITTPLRLSHLMAQMHVESMGYSHLVESLNYSAKRMTQVWPARFPTIAAAAPYAHNPADLANKVYQGRMGNVNPGDGFRFIGRSLKMITGRENYTKCAGRTGLDLVNHPELAADPEHSILIACDYWRSRNINRLADRDDAIAVTEAVNGGRVMLKERQAMLAKAKALIFFNGGA